MGVDAADPAESAGVPAEPEIRQLDVAVRSDRHVHDLSVPRDVNRDLPVQPAGQLRQFPRQIFRKKLSFVRFRLVQLVQLPDHGVPDSFGISLYVMLHLTSFLFCPSSP